MLPEWWIFAVSAAAGVLSGLVAVIMSKRNLVEENTTVADLEQKVRILGEFIVEQGLEPPIDWERS